MAHKINNLLPIQEEISSDTASKYAIIDGKEVDFDLKSCAGSYLVVVFLTGARHPQSEEMVKRFSDALPRFAEVNCKVVAICCDTTLDIFDMLENDSLGKVEKFMPIMSDRNYKISNSFGTLLIGERHGHLANSVFVLDTEQRVRHVAVLEPTVAHQGWKFISFSHCQ